MELGDIKDIFHEVRKNFIWTADGKHKVAWRDGFIHVKDQWNLMQPDEKGILRGDCEDFCLYCSKQIKEKFGILKADRLLTYTKTETDEGHCILCVKIGDREYVLDNRQRQVVTLQKLKRSGYSDFARPKGSVAGPWLPL